MTIALNTPEQIALLRVMTGIHAIALEINTGIKATRGFSGVRFAKTYGFTGRTLKGALTYLTLLFDEEYEFSASVQRALAK